MIFIFLILALIINNVLLWMFIEKEYLFENQDIILYKIISIYYPALSFIILYFIGNEYTLTVFSLLTIGLIGIFSELFINSENGSIRGPKYNVYNNISIEVLDNILVAKCKDDYILKVSLDNFKEDITFQYSAEASLKLKETITQYYLFKDEEEKYTNFKLTQSVNIGYGNLGADTYVDIQSFVYRKFSKKIYY